MSIQDHVVAVVRFTTDRPGSVSLVEAVGTAFFIDERGTFVTAAAVLQTEVPGASLGLALRMRDGPAPQAVVPVLAREFADPPWDVALGRVDVATRRRFVLEPVQAASLIWETVACYGCVALDRPAAGRPAVPLFRARTGNLMRELAGDGQRSAPGFEASFVVPARPRGRLVGICTGNGSLGELGLPGCPAGGAGVDCHGLVQDLRGLAHWRPSVLDGRALRDAINA